ncbi:MAG: hypothetical protein B7Y47_14250 [Sphingomonas sp. 28-63-12]|nr:MAG: hypothetical protein B7Y47_14250 [Sphingomonas sp. 28-63-12]
MSGQRTGVVLARPAASAIAAIAGWRAIFLASSVQMVMIGIVFVLDLPRRVPTRGKTDAEIIGSPLTPARSHQQLRRRVAYQGAMFFMANLFGPLHRSSCSGNSRRRRRRLRCSHWLGSVVR